MKPGRFCLVDDCVGDAGPDGRCADHSPLRPRCVVRGCAEDRYARDLCENHYEKLRRDIRARQDPRGRRSARARTPEEADAFEPLLPSVEVVGAGPIGTTVLVLNDTDVDAVAALVDQDARRIAILLWHHIGAASFAGVEPFTLRPRNSGVTP